MKMCWDNLVRIRLSSHGNLTIGKHVIDEGVCDYCGELMIYRRNRKNHCRYKYCDTVCCVASVRLNATKNRGGYSAVHLDKTLSQRASIMRSSSKYRARKKKLEHSLSHDWYMKKLEKGICEITKIPFVYTSDRMSPRHPSVDRIDSSKGYTEDNCRMILWCINSFKGNGSDKEMYHIAKAIIDKKRR